MWLGTVGEFHFSDRVGTKLRVIVGQKFAAPKETAIRQYLY